MVDFKKRLIKKDIGKRIDPIELYETLDRASDKGELRTPQREILKEWHESLRSSSELIVKLHTGQGKTLIGLLMLQSKLNEGAAPALYLCPNNFLIEQTCSQAKQFGFHVSVADPDLPQEFLSGDSILITSVQKLFNGFTKFGLGTKSIKVGTLLMDDSHACIDSIRDAFCLKLPADHNGYRSLVDLFATQLEEQGAGTFADIKEGTGNDLLPIPYWAWHEKASDVVRLLAKVSTTDQVKFVWPLIRDNLAECQCIVSSRSLEIAPYLPPLDLFGSYFRAEHRLFMSATVTDDSFLVRGLRLPPSVIRNPLVYKKERWSGEKMILIPSLIDEGLSRTVIVKEFAPPKQRQYGVVALTPSFAGSQDWKAYKAVIADSKTINAEIEELKNRHFDNTLVIVNRYDGIDLPDDTCRVLIFDSKPYAENLIERYAEECRGSSEVTAIRIARAIEQGLGRSVRGEKDYCVIVLVGPELVSSVRTAGTRRYLSAQTQAQVEIGLEIAEMAKEDLGSNTTALECFRTLVNQCVKRDQGWKDYYVEKMDTVGTTPTGGSVLDIFEKELEAEICYHQKRPKAAVEIIQDLVDKQIKDDSDVGWYLQQMARYTFMVSKTDSNKLQIEAHRKNRFLIKPRDGMEIDKILVLSQKRIERIDSWLHQFPSSEALSVRINDILSRLVFGVRSERFESALDDLGKSLGFECQRPDKQWGQGPDNLWGLRDGEYLLFECKSEVALGRAEMNKSETGQMNNACAWFERQYPGAKLTPIIIIPTKWVSPAAGFTREVEVMRAKELGRLVSNVKHFFDEIRAFDLKDISEQKIQGLLDSNELTIDGILANYSAGTQVRGA